ncbi:MAG: penicillin-binding protein 2 [Candidatus Magasanikbacteria bacterium]|nr:penicillin-binding protein 2 [Candidatus Magasanikbacteria bacterium]
MLAKEPKDLRLRLIFIFFTLLAVVITARLFYLMILQRDFYAALAGGSREVFSDLFPKRGQIFIQDSRTGEQFPVAMNRDYFIVFVETREIKNDTDAENAANKLAEVFGYDEEKKLTVFLQVNKRDDPYEPIENKVDEAAVDKLKELNLPGLGFVRKTFRFYPEGKLASQVIGFLGKDKNGNDVGRYGIEGYWQKELAGSGGFIAGARSPAGGLIPLAGWSFSSATDGVDLLLTIDRSLQYKACEKLARATQEYGAVSAALVIMDPKTGAIRAMCSVPEFDPNQYGKADSAGGYNNSTIFTQYEPGSVFKPITMAAALNEGAVTAESGFNDTGSRSGLCSKPIKNAAEKVYNYQSLSEILENSVNTGAVYLAEKLGKKKFVEYVENFGFGIKSGVELDSEVSGNIDTLFENKPEKVDCYTATASFGQGITATPLQLVSAFSAIANGGKLFKPFIIDEIRRPDGSVDKIKPKEIRLIKATRNRLV